MSYEINLRFRRFGYGTGQLTGLTAHYIALRPQDARRGSSVSRPQYLANLDLIHEPATISPCTFTMDHDAIICSMIDRLARGPDADVHVPSVGSTKVPFSACRTHIFVIDYRLGSMVPSEAAITIIGGPRVIDVFYGNGAPSGPNYLLFSDVDRLVEVSRVGIVVCKRLHRIRHRCGSLVLSESPGSHCQAIHGPVGRLVERNRPTKSLKRRRVRRRRLTVYSTDPRRPQGHLLGRD